MEADQVSLQEQEVEHLKKASAEVQELQALVGVGGSLTRKWAEIVEDQNLALEGVVEDQ